MDKMNNTNNTNNMNGGGVDLREILAVIRKRVVVILVITLAAVLAGGYLSYFVMVPVYQTDAMMLVTQAAPQNPVSNNGAGMEGLMDSIAKLPQMTINTYVGQLKSEAVMEKVVQKLKLDKLGYTAKGLAGIIYVEPVKDTNLIRLSVTNTDPYMAAKIANTLTQEFLSFISLTSEEQMSKSVDFLKKQAVSSGEELEKAVTNLNTLQAQSRGVEMLEKLVAVKTEDLSKYQSQSLQTGMEYQQAQAGVRQAEKQLKSTPMTIKMATYDAVKGNSIIVEQINPAYNELKSMINTKTVIFAEKGAEVKNLQVITNKLSEELKALQGEVGKKKSFLQVAQNEVARLNGTNSLLLSKLDETNISRSMKFGETNLMVISPATVPLGPVAPNKGKIMLQALLIGLIVSLILAFLLNHIDNTVKTPKEVEAILGVPVLGQIPSYNHNITKARGEVKRDG